MTTDVVEKASTGISPWWTVLAGALGSAAGAGIFVVYCFGVFVNSVAEEFGWQRGTVTLGISCFLLTTGIGTVLLGFLINRYSLKLTAALFVLLFAICVCTVGMLPASPLLFYITFSLMGLFGAAATALPYAVSITAYFDKRRGIALGAMIAGGGIGGFVAPQVSEYLLTEIGWRASVIGIGAVFGITGLFALLALTKNPPQKSSQTDEDNIPLSKRISLTLAHIVTKEFIYIALGIFIVSIATFGVLASLVPLLTDKGMTVAQAATVLSIAGLASWINKFVTGWSLDNFQGKHVTAVVFFITLLGVLLIAFGEPGVQMYIGAALVGIGLGAEADLVTFLVSRYFPFSYFSRLVGIMWVTWAWGGGVGTTISSRSYDLSGNYVAGLLIFAGLLVVAIIMILRLGPYAYPAEKG